MKSQNKIVILMGPPGSGKGTQAVRLADALKVPHISSGDIFRENIKNGTPLGKIAKEAIDQGKLVTDELTIDLIVDRMKREDCKEGFILDGVPRTVNQAIALEKFIDHRNVLVLNLMVPDADIIQRLTGRRTCKQCGHIHHVVFSPPAREGHCDRCGGELMQRSDDTESVIRTRLQVYHQQTAPVLEYYKKTGHLREINGVQDPKGVFNDLMKALNISFE